MLSRKRRQQPSCSRRKRLLQPLLLQQPPQPVPPLCSPPCGRRVQARGAKPRTEASPWVPCTQGLSAPWDLQKASGENTWTFLLKKKKDNKINSFFIYQGPGAVIKGSRIQFSLHLTCQKFVFMLSRNREHPCLLWLPLRRASSPAAAASCARTSANLSPSLVCLFWVARTTQAQAHLLLALASPPW